MMYFRAQSTFFFIIILTPVWLMSESSAPTRGPRRPVPLQQQAEAIDLSTVAKRSNAKIAPVKQTPSSVVVPADSYDINMVRVIISTPDGTEIITQADIDRPSLMGAKRTIEELIDERLIFLDAKRHKALSDEEAVDRYLAGVMRDNNLGLDDVKRMFANAGRTFEEGREELKMMQAVSGMMGNKVYSGVIVPRKQVLAYFESHPEYEPANYYISFAFVPFTATKSKQEQEADLRAQAARDAILWGSPFWIRADEIADEKKFILESPTIEPIETTKGFELFKIIEKKPARLRTLDERYNEIVDVLAQPRYEELLNQYKASLHKSATITYT